MLKHSITALEFLIVESLLIEKFRLVIKHFSYAISEYLFTVVSIRY
ncbi:hypothetical protein VAE122_2980279 [Vibrio aestuarianus]|nr:hypothetical protein VAE122_2980279 [Vibrio aestuarianus]